MSLSDKVAVVTGGSRGIGRAVCLRLASQGAKVIVNFVGNQAAAEETVKAITDAGGTAEYLKFNVADAAEVEAAFKKILDDHGRVDILVNNAGITRDTLLMKMKEAQWDEVMNTNLKGAFLCTKSVTRAMMKQRAGRIINITSVIGHAGNAGQANYAAAKAGMTGFTKSVARELASRGITANAVAPGYVVTDMTKDLADEVTEKIKSEIPLGVLGEADDVAHAVSFLASDEARYITGEVIHVNGGMLMA